VKNNVSTEEAWRLIHLRYKEKVRINYEFFQERRLLLEREDVYEVLDKIYEQREFNLYLDIVEGMETESIVPLFPELLRGASVVKGEIERFRLAILRLPHKWLLENVEAFAEPLLEGGDDEEVRRLLELYQRIDPDLTRRLAQRAMESDDPHKQEAGKDFIVGA
jgi:hypothetical protein